MCTGYHVNPWNITYTQFFFCGASPTISNDHSTSNLQIDHCAFVNNSHIRRGNSASLKWSVNGTANWRITYYFFVRNPAPLFGGTGYYLIQNCVFDEEVPITRFGTRITTNNTYCFFDVP
jgi:hypothetical protein